MLSLWRYFQWGPGQRPIVVSTAGLRRATKLALAGGIFLSRAPVRPPPAHAPIVVTNQAVSASRLTPARQSHVEFSRSIVPNRTGLRPALTLTSARPPTRSAVAFSRNPQPAAAVVTQKGVAPIVVLTREAPPARGAFLLSRNPQPATAVVSLRAAPPTVVLTRGPVRRGAISLSRNPLAGQKGTEAVVVLARGRQVRGSVVLVRSKVTASTGRQPLVVSRQAAALPRTRVVLRRAPASPQRPQPPLIVRTWQALRPPHTEIAISRSAVRPVVPPQKGIQPILVLQAGPRGRYIPHGLYVTTRTILLSPTPPCIHGRITILPRPQGFVRWC